MGQIYERFLGPAPHLTSGQFTTETASGRPAVCCKRCGERSEVAQRVLVGGAVIGEWTCPHRCGESCFITLMDIDEPVAPA